MQKKIAIGICDMLIAAAALSMSIMGICSLYDSPFRRAFMQPCVYNAVLEMILIARLFFRSTVNQMHEGSNQIQPRGYPSSDSNLLAFIFLGSVSQCSEFLYFERM